MMSGRWLTLILLAAIVALILFAPSSAVPLREAFFDSQRALLSGEENGMVPPDAVALRTHEAVRQVCERALGGGAARDRIAAPVHSRYPFNFKREFTIGAGIREGVKENMAVLVPVPSRSASETAGRAPDALLVGMVAAVRDYAAVVQTVFDARLTLSVRVGEEGVDALLVGGDEPTLTLLPKESVVRPGDAVYAAAPGISYGTPIGLVKTVRPAADELFREATITFGYNLADIRMVLVDRGSL